MLAADSAAWRNPRVLTILLFVFTVGALSGALTMRVGLHQALHHLEPSWKQGNKELFLQRFKTELKLSPEQTEKIAKVLVDYGMYYQNLQEQLDEVRATGKTRILEVLDPEQKKKFERMMSDLK